MRCSGCRHDNPPEARFCLHCGTRLAAACAQCGTELPVAARFCPACGSPVGGGAAEGARAAAAAGPAARRDTDRILAAAAAAEGERKQVTVLFADLKGSTEMVAGRDPEHAERLIRPYVDTMANAVRRYGGTVNLVMGDGIMSLFGAPLAHEDHALRACYAALAMQDAVHGLAAQGGDPGTGEAPIGDDGAAPPIRIGIHSGEVVVRTIDTDLSLDYTAMGETVHLAARMEQAAAPGSILLTADTLKLVEGRIAVEAVGRLPMRGMPGPIESFRLVGAGAVRSRLEAAAARGLTRFVGRTSELAALRAARDKALAGRGQVVALVGEPGVGKSRLFWEFLHSDALDGWRLMHSSSASYGSVTPYLPVIDLLKAYLHIDPRDEAPTIRDKMTRRLRALDPRLEPAATALLSVLDVATEDADWPALDPPQRRRRTLEALVRVLLRESEVQPLCLAIEDLHWIDSETQAFLNAVIESLPTARILLFVNYRPEYHHIWENKTYYTQLRIDPLTPEHSDVLLGLLLADGCALDPLKRLLIARTEGNPFFLEESVRTLVESGTLVGEPGAFRLAGPIEEIRIPDTVQAVLAARIDRLPPAEKRLLQTAAVIGRNVPFALLQAATGESEEALRPRLDALGQAEFLYAASLFPAVEYTFKHGLTHQVAYRSLLQTQRRELHARILDAIERLYPDRSIENIEQLGHHALHGERWETALAYLWRAGIKVASRSAHGEAVKAFEQALSALAHLPGTRETLERAVDLRFDLRNSLWATGKFSRILDHLIDAERLAAALDDPRRSGWIGVYISACLWQLGRSAEARARAGSAKAIADILDDLPLRIAATFYLGCTHVTANDVRTAEPLFASIAESLAGDLARERCGMPFLPSVVARSWLVWLLAERGAFAEGLAHGREAVRIAEVSGQPFNRAHIYYDLGYLYDLKGDPADAVEALERARALIGRWNLVYLSPFVTGFLGHAYAMADRVSDGLALLDRANAEYGRMGLGLFRALVGVQRGEALLLAGRRAHARTATEAAVALARRRGEDGHAAYGLRVLAEIAAREGGADAAKRFFRQALAEAERLEMRPLLAHCHRGLGRLCRQLGDRSEGNAHLDRAEALYRAMDMTLWLDPERDCAPAPG